MRTTFFSILFSFSLAFFPISSMFAQVFNVRTSVDSIGFCPGASRAFPVTIQNMIGVDSFKLVLGYDPSVISYQSYQFLNTQLTGGNFSISGQTGSISMNWHRPTIANIINDTLIWLVFKGTAGNTDLVWDTLNCIYHDSASGNPLPAIYKNGKATVSPAINLFLTEMNSTCTGKCNANFMATISGGVKPYAVLWDGEPGRFDTIQTNLCDGANTIRITDKNGCELDSTYQINGLPGAKVTIKIKCEQDTTTVLFRENPILTFSFEEISPTHVIEPPLWSFGDGDTSRSFNPTHIYRTANANTDKFYLLTLYIKNQNGCDTVITMRIPIKDQKLKISNVMVPTGTEKNRVFTIFDENNDPISNQYIRLELFVFDRWGRKLYANTDYKNDWNAGGAPDGVYYYVVNTVGFFNTDKHKGSLTIIGSK